MSKQYKFLDFQILETLDSTHSGNTKLYVIRYQGRIQVCKSISKSFFQDVKSVEHIKNEKQALIKFTQLKNKGINQIIDTFQDNQNIYMLLQLVQGLPLHKLLQMAGPLNSDFTRLIVTQVGLIMSEFHQQGFIYRDIKASNFMINQKGQVKMIDLGKAKKIDKFKTYTICGTTHSMPPQVYNKEEGYGYEFDYYGFGVLIYELLTATAPFGYGNFSEQYLKTIQQGLNDKILQPIHCHITRNLIKKLMSKKQDRLGTTGGFEQILQHEYFNCPQFLDYKDILQGEMTINKQDERFAFYISEIEDFGLEMVKYNEIKQDDPFYKFYS